MENDQKLGLYEVYGDTKEDIVENISQNIEDSGKNLPIEEETPIIEENTPNLQWEEFMHPDFPWAKKNLWINNPKAVQYWISTKKGTEKEYSKFVNESENTKTY